MRWPWFWWRYASGRGAARGAPEALRTVEPVHPRAASARWGAPIRGVLPVAPPRAAAPEGMLRAAALRAVTPEELRRAVVPAAVPAAAGTTAGAPPSRSP